MGKDHQILVACTSYPLYYFSKRIGGDKIEVILPIPDMEDPSHFFPDEQQTQDFQSADLIVRNGADYEPWIDHVSLSRRKMLNTSAAFSDQYIRLPSVSHSHGGGEEHTHEEWASHTWLYLRFANQQAFEIKERLAEMDPENSDIYKKNYGELANELMALDQEIQNILESHRGKTIYSAQPIYQYFGSGYFVDVIPLDLENDIIPENLEEEALPLILFEKEPSQETRLRCEERGLSFVVFDPCLAIPESGDFLSVMKDNIKNLDAALALIP